MKKKQNATRHSRVFRKVLEDARAQLNVSSNAADTFVHSGIRGDERAAALISFFRKHLPSNYGVAKGEALDYRDKRTGQLDIVIYDSALAAPISVQEENVLIPAESLLAVIEVKTRLTQDELNLCYKAAKKVRALKPYKENFVPARTEGSAAIDKNHRCLYVVFAYKSNLGDKDWLLKEFVRVKKAAARASANSNVIDIISVLDRGLIRPGGSVGKNESSAQEDMFLEFYLHIINFLGREQARRPQIDWQNYVTRSSKGWEKLK